MDRLNPLDAAFIDAEDEDRHTSMAIASIAVFEGPAPSYDEFYQAVAERLPLVPIYRRKLRTVPLRLGRPVWVDDPQFDLRYHLRGTALPEPGGDEQLSNLMARVMSQRLDRDYPLWEYWLVEGLNGGRWALISKVHHCMVDGVSGTDLYRVIFDLSPAPSPPLADDRAVEPEPSAFRLAAGAALEMLTLPAREAGALASAAAHPGDTVRQAARTARAVARLAPALWPVARSSLSGQIGQQRRYTWARASLDEVKAIKQGLGGTVNDVVLAAISGGFRALLLARGEQPEPHKVPSLVPVSLRAPGEESIYENRVSALVARLPVHVADPVERLTAVQAELADLKASREERVGEALVSLGRYAPFPLVSRGLRFAFSPRGRLRDPLRMSVPALACGALLSPSGSLCRLGLRPDSVEKPGDLGGQPGGLDPQLGERARPDEPGVGELPREVPGVAERVDQVDPVSQDQRRRGYGPALLDGRSDGSQKDAVQHGCDLVRIRPGSRDERIERSDPGERQAGRDRRDQPHPGPGVVHPDQQRQEHPGRRRHRPLQHRHLQDQSAHPPGCLHRGQQAHVGSQRDAPEHRLIHAELVQKAQDLPGVKVHPVGAGVAGLVAAPVTQEVEQHHPVAAGGQGLGQAPAEVSVEQQAVQPHQHPVARAVDLVGQPVLAEGHVPGAVGAGYGAVLRADTSTPLATARSAEQAGRSAEQSDQSLHRPSGRPATALAADQERDRTLGLKGPLPVTFVPTVGLPKPDTLRSSAAYQRSARGAMRGLR
jgi:diacylglycerol O-acyltransferase